MTPRRGILAALLAAGLPASGAPTPARAATLGDDGLYHEPWFLDSFLDLPDDLATATAAGKALVVAWELRGCPFCAEIHRVHLADPATVAFLVAHFDFVQIDIIGARPVTFPDTVRLAEKAQARRLGIVGTPTFQVFGPGGERGRLAGAVKPAEFLAFFRSHAPRA